MAREVRLIEAMAPAVRLDLVLRVAAWTRQELPDEQRRALRRRADPIFDRAVKFVQSCQRGEGFSKRVYVAMLDQLESLYDRREVALVGPLIEGFSLAAAGDVAVDGTTEALQAFYDAIRDAARLPGSDVVTGDSLDPAERESGVCRAVIAKQRAFIAAASA
jgi:hypothetical protein